MPRKRLEENIEIRKGQLITTFGIGNLVNSTDNQSFIVAGMDDWEAEYDREPDSALEYRISEPRLAARLGVKFFMQPPHIKYEDRIRKNLNLFVPTHRFPGWHYCDRCYRMEYFKPDETEIFCHNTACKKKKASDEKKPESEVYDPVLIPIRFAAVCEEGHLEDFPFLEWVHFGKSAQFDLESHILSFNSTGKGDLDGIRIDCSCGIKKNFRGALSMDGLKGIEKKCGGGRPWLGLEETVIPGKDALRDCKSVLTGIQKGASNFFYSNCMESIWIPDSALNQLQMQELEENAEIIGTKLLTLGISETSSTDEVREVIRDYIIDLVFSHAEDYKEEYVDQLMILCGYEKPDEVPDDEESFRFREYQTFLTYGGKNQDFLLENLSMSLFKDSMVKKHIASVILLHKIIITTAFVSFTRLDPTNRGKRSDLSRKANIEWLPAVKTRGEGIFIELEDELVAAWANHPSVKKQLNRMTQNYTKNGHGKTSEKQILLHSLAHALINELSFVSGYGNSAIRERIYCNLDSKNNMNGILLYTSSGDTEGSLGGLVRQGNPENLTKILHDAADNMGWCSADPICMQVGSNTGQGPNHINGAACHNCLILPEVSCEEMNLLLDRATLIGNLDDDSIGYLNFEPDA